MQFAYSIIKSKKDTTKILLIFALVVAAVAIYFYSSSRAAATINVKQYGAKADGITDDSVAIQRAALLAGGGGQLYFPVGNYVFKNVQLASGTTVVFQNGTTVKAPTSQSLTDKYGFMPAEIDAFLKIDDKSNVTINGNGVILNGGYSSHGATYPPSSTIKNTVEDGIFVRKSNAVVINNVVANNFQPDPTELDSMAHGSGFTFHASNNIQVNSSSTTNSYYGVFMNEVTGGAVIGNKTNHSFRDGIIAYKSHEIKINNNVVTDYTFGGDEGRAGIHLYGSENLTVNNNIVKSAYVKNEGDVPTGTRLMGNSDIIQALTYDPEGIRFRNARSFLCSGNNVDGNLNNSSISVMSVAGDDSFYKAGYYGGDGIIANNTVTNGKLGGIVHIADGVGDANKAFPVTIIGNKVKNISKRQISFHNPALGYEATGIMTSNKGSRILFNSVNGIDGNGIVAGGPNVIVSGNNIYNVGRDATLNIKTGVLNAGTNNIITNNAVTDYISTNTGDYHPTHTTAYGTYQYGTASAPASAYLGGNTIFDSSNSIKLLYNGANTTTITSTEKTPPSIPTMSTITQPSVGSAKLSWATSSDVSGVAGYRVERADDVNGAPGAYSIVGATVTYKTFTDKGLVRGKAYWYRVSALDNKGNLSKFSVKKFYSK